jgi:hypothetical protein
MSENVALILTLILAITIFVVGTGVLVYEEMDLDFNGGKCEICGENVIPVGHQFSTDYYCINCQRYNEGK